MLTQIIMWGNKMTINDLIKDISENIRIVSSNSDILKIVFPKDEEFYSGINSECTLEVGVDPDTGRFVDYTKGNVFFVEIVHEGDSYNMRCWENELKFSSPQARINLHNSVDSFVRYFYEENTSKII